MESRFISSYSGFTLLRLAFVAGVIACAVPAPLAAATGAGWELTKIDGHDYVSVESIKRFYGFTKLAQSGDSVVLENTKVRMNLKVHGLECLMNNVKFVFTNEIKTEGEKVYVSRMDLSKLIDPVLRPNFIRNAGDFHTVILDPGHGGKDPGATNSFGTEAGYTLKVALLTKSMLEKQGFKVIMTRSDDRYLTLQERVDIANAVNESAVFVCIHFNCGDRAARGIETFTLSPPGVTHYGRDLVPADNQLHTGNEHDSANIALATAVHGTLLRQLGTLLRQVQSNTFDRGIKHARFSVLSGVKHPAILLEAGFVSNPYEASLINNDTYQNTVASSIVYAVATKYRFAVSQKPPVREGN